MGSTDPVIFFSSTGSSQHTKLSYDAKPVISSHDQGGQVIHYSLGEI